MNKIDVKCILAAAKYSIDLLKFPGKVILSTAIVNAKPTLSWAKSRTTAKCKKYNTSNKAKLTSKYFATRRSDKRFKTPINNIIISNGKPTELNNNISNLNPISGIWDESS